MLEPAHVDIQSLLIDRLRTRKIGDWRLEETLGAETRASKNARDARAQNFGLGRRDAKNLESINEGRQVKEK